MNDHSKRGTGESRGGVAEPTIVGGRPSSTRGSQSGIPQGIEVLVKKASVDPEFRKMLLEQRAKAAGLIDLELSPAEAAMLDSVPRAQIERIIENTTVPDEQRRVFLGKMGVAMLAMLGIGLSTVACGPVYSRGISPDRPFPHPMPRGIRPDDPSEPPPSDHKKAVTAVRVKPKKERLNVKVALRGIYALAITVGYDCPFDRGVVRVMFRGYDEAAGDSVTCVPAAKEISKGKGEVVFSAEAKKVTTNRILVGLLNATGECRKEAPTDFQAMPDVEPGEYTAGDCVLCRVVEYHKLWPS